MAHSINTRMGEAALRHMTFLLQLENGAIKRLIDVMEDAQDNILRILNSASDTIPVGTDDLQALSPSQQFRLNQISTEIDTVLVRSNEILSNTLHGELVNFANVEGQMLIDILSRQIPPSAGLELQFNRIPVDQIERLVNTPLGGELYHERLSRNIGDASRRIKASMTDSMIRGDTIKQSSRRVQAVLGDTLINRAETLVRTEYARVANQANLAAMRQNSEFLKGFIWISTLDVTTCVICMDLHGEKFPVDTDVMPPEHPRCRCYMMPQLKNAKDLEIADSVPEDVRDLFDGNPPDIPLDFDEFLSDQTPEFRVQSLGQARSDLFDQGMSVRDMASDDRILSLDELGELAN